MNEKAGGQEEARGARYALLYEGKKIGTITFVEKGDDVEIKVDTGTAEVLEQLRSALAQNDGTTEEGKAAEGQPSSDELKDPRHTLAKVAANVLRKVEALGFNVRELPSGDVQIRMEVDIDGGRTVATVFPLHEFADPSRVATLGFDALARAGATARATMAQKITEGLAAGNAETSAQAIIEWARIGPIYGVTKTDLEEARRVPVEPLPARLREKVLSIRLAVAGQLRDLGEHTENELRALIDEFGAGMEVAKRAGLDGFEGAVARAKGYKATAIRHWKAAAEKGNDSTRGQAFLGLSLAYPTNDLEAARYAEQAADAMLQVGDRKEAARCLQRLAVCLLVRDPKRAVESIDRALGLLGPNLLDRDWKGGLLHYKAVALEKLGHANAALEVAAQAADERRDLLGAEVERHSSLTLASLIARDGGNTGRADELKTEADRLAEAFSDPRSRLRHAAGEIALNYDSATAATLLEEAEELGDTEAAVLLVTIRAVHEGTPEQRLQWLEGALVRLRTMTGPRGDPEVVLQALARELMNQGETDLAIRNYQEVLALNPFNQEARQNTAALLQSSGRWREAVDFFETQREIFGERPVLLYCLGKSYLQLGNVNAAATALMRSKAAVGASEELKDRAEQLIHQAMQQGGMPDLTKQVAQPDIVTHAEFEEKLREMGRFFAAEKRMSLWKSDGTGKHKWVEHPEARAQDTVTAFLSGSFGTRVEVLEAVAAGAGFVDLYVIGQNGFRAIVELKMLGEGYSSTYAFAGENQIAHYMEQKKVAIGYLVIFDARKRDFGIQPEETAVPANKTVRILLVDVRPDSPSKQH